MNITYKDSEGKELKYFTQWDINRTLELDGIDNSSAMIHFYNRLSSRALVVQPKKQLEKYVVNVPNILLQEPCDIIVAVFVENGEEGKTEEIFSIPVEAKTKPEDYTFEENIDYINWVELNEQAKKQLEELQRLTKEIQDKYDSGAFKGDKGDRGSGIKSISKIATNGLKDTYRILFDDGKTYDYYITNGKTPVKGVDYYTIAEKEQLVNEVIEDSTNKFNTNVVEKTNTFNSNASQKLQDYNSNHTTKFKAYNDNADTRYDSYNSNADTKFNDFNSNATAKTSTYNTNATDKLNTYNKNAENKFNTYNDNATTKFNAYNTNDETKKTAYNNNAIDKLKEYNDNTTAKIEEYNTNATTKLDEFNTNASDYNKRITSNTKRIKTIEKNIFDSGEAEGENLNINDTALAEFQQVDMQINKAQNTTEGYNLEPQVNTTQTINGITYSVQKNGTIIASGTATENSIFPITNIGPNIVEPRDYTLEKGNYYLIDGVGNYKEYFTQLFYKNTIDGDKFINTGFTGILGTIDFQISEESQFRTILYIRKGITVKNLLFEPRIVKSENKDKPYEPYTGGIASPNPNYQQPINTIKNNFEFTSCGKNLFDKSKVEQGRFYDIELDKIATVRVWSMSDYIRAKTVNDKFIFSHNIVDKFQGNFSVYDINKNLLGGGYPEHINNQEIIINLKLCKNVSDKSKIRYVRIGFRNDLGIDLDKVMIERDSSTITYEPYTGITNTVNLKGNEFLPGDRYRLKFNETDGKYWKYLEKNMGKVVLNGSENWKNQFGVNLFGIGINKYSKYNNAISNYYIYNTVQTGLNEKLPNREFTIQFNQAIYIKDERFSTVQEFKTWLETHNTEVVYELKDEEKELIPIEPIDIMNMTYYPLTNAFTSIDNIFLKAKYYRDFVNTIRNMQIDNNTLKNQLQDIEKRLSAVESKPTVEPEPTVEEVVPNA